MPEVFREEDFIEEKNPMKITQEEDGTWLARMPGIRDMWVTGATREEVAYHLQAKMFWELAREIEELLPHDLRRNSLEEFHNLQGPPADMS